MAARVSDEFQRHVSAWVVVQDIYPELMKDMIHNTWPSPLVDKLLKGDLGQRLVKTFNTQQQRLVQSINTEGYRELDTELMYKIIRHLGLVDAPSSGWGKKPGSNDKTQGDDIERMRCNRNNVVHRPRLSLTENEYNEFFAESIDIAKRMDTNLGNPSNGFQKKIEDVKHLTVSPENGNKYLASNPEYQGSVFLNSMRKLNIYFGNDVKLRIENNKIENESTQCILYVRDPAMTDTSEIVRLLEEAKHTINEGKCEIKLLSIEEGSLIIHAFFNQGLKEMKYIYEELTLLFNYIFELNYADKNCGQQIYIVLAESEDTVIEDPSDDLEPFVLKPDCNPIQLLKMNVIVQNSSFQSVQTLHSAVHCFVDSVSNSVYIGDSHRNGSSMDVVMIKNQNTKDQSDYSSFQSEQTLQSAVHGNVNSVDNSVDIGTVKRNGSSTDVVTIANHKEKDELNMSSYQKQGNRQNRIFSSKCGQNVHIQGNSVEWCSVNSGGRLYIETALQPNALVVLRLTGSGHADIGILTKNPMSFPLTAVDNMKELTVMQTARIHKQDGLISIRRSEDGCQVSTISDHPNNKIIRQKDEIWITVNIIFGSLKVKIESNKYRFALHKGGNTTLNEDRSTAGLTYKNPSAVCFLQNPIVRGETAYFHIMPIMKDGKMSRNFATKIAVSGKNPEQFIPPKQEFYDITCFDVTHADQLKRKTKQEVKVRLTTEGSVEVITQNGKTFVVKEHTTTTYILFDLCRVKVKYMGTFSEKEVSNQNVADAIIPYFKDTNFKRSKTEVSDIQRDIYNLSICSSDENASYHVGEHGASSARSDRSEHYSDFKQRLQEIEDNVNQYECEKQKQLSAENFELLQAENRVIQSDIQAIKDFLQQLIRHIEHKNSQTQPTENPGGLISMTQAVPHITHSLKDMIQKNFVDLVNCIEPFPFCDHLYQNDFITQYEYEEFRLKSSKMDINRDILSKLSIRNIDPYILRSILQATKQGIVLAKLFP